MKKLFMMKNLLIIWIVCVMLLAQSCVSNSAFQTGRTMGADKVQLMLATSTSNYDGTADGGSVLNFDQFPENQQFHGSIRIGITDKFEFNSNASVGLNVFSTDSKFKYQILGDQASKFAASVGLGVGYDVIYLSLDVPTYFSYHPTSKFAIYTSPRYRFAVTPLDRYESNHALGLVSGLKFGSKWAVYVEHGYTRSDDFGWIWDDGFRKIRPNNVLYNIHQVNVGVGFTF